MGRKEPAKGKHSSPSKAGVKNKLKETPRELETDTLLDRILETVENGKKNQAYKGLWTEETFAEQVTDYFKYCAEKHLKPNKAGLRNWLGCSRTQYYDWETKAEKHGYKTNILDMAHSIMEDQIINRGEQFPTFNTFLLKTAHGHIETSKLDINQQTTVGTTEDVLELISKLGLDRSK